MLRSVFVLVHLFFASHIVPRLQVVHVYRIQLFFQLSRVFCFGAITCCIFDMDEAVDCVVCKKLEADADKILTCLYCFSTAHFKCRNISGKAVKKVKANMYFCTVKCSEIFKRINDMLIDKTSTVNEIKSIVLNIVVSQLDVMKSEVKSVSDAIEKSQEFLSSKFEDILKDYTLLRQENENLKLQMNDVKFKLSTLEKTVNGMEGKLSMSELDEVANNAMILGIPYFPEENVSDLVLKTASQVGVNLLPESLVSVKRLDTFNKTNQNVPIKVVFKNRNDKELVLSKKRSFGKVKTTHILDNNINHKEANVIIRDELTPLALDLLKNLRALQAKHSIRYVWPGRRGAILVKQDDLSKPESIKTKNDFNVFVARLLTSPSLSSSSSKY